HYRVAKLLICCKHGKHFYNDGFQTHRYTAQLYALDTISVHAYAFVHQYQPIKALVLTVL
ncbi:MAG: hypothetical protein ACXVB6_20255, partial [Mucilaginibacter sp.]